MSSILGNINIVAEKLYSSIDENIYGLLDKFLIVDKKILSQAPLKYLFAKEQMGGFAVLISSFAVMFVVCFAIKQIVSMYSGEKQEEKYKFLIKIIICTICASSSYYICEMVLDINGILTKAILSIGEELTGTVSSFESLREIITDLESKMSNDFISVDGMIKGLLSFGTVSLLLNFAIRYVMLFLIIVLSPIAIMLAVGNVSKGVFYSWVKMFVINLLVQNFVVLILVIPIASKKLDVSIFKVILVGTIYILYKINNYVGELFSQFSIKGGTSGK